MISPELLSILCCPESHQALNWAEPELVAKLNQDIATGRVRNRGGAAIHEPIEAGLIRADRQYLYPVRRQIPVLLIDEAIPLTPGSVDSSYPT
jgi:uncharacterized protein YbaR (Trm112 family)